MATQTGNTYIPESMTYHKNYNGKPKIFDQGALEESI